jgi:hypothetical protein
MCYRLGNGTSVIQSEVFQYPGPPSQIQLSIISSPKGKANWMDCPSEFHGFTDCSPYMIMKKTVVTPCFECGISDCEEEKE